MPKRDPIPAPVKAPRKPRGTSDMPDRDQQKPGKPPKSKPEDTKNPTDPALLPIGDPAGMA
ncbi:hypothetical protein PYH37_000610 [Sinorhizobium numidicum]|uniref:Uncharacterized protein n=1 Tax=Sinorhizobium numidicum TaxID=680248 RepID=A0ABY8CWV9_9HYPH|nr:hypothetical protein [Sinorhizobium numidicum]WEX75228.1 hypothetical protein PYH37_000610 [Sinorhizobium numidicum]WEX81223.1 hypothetical protein PYH38_000612 [Sinorhizobium numidicum]